ncbi:MAG: hypothetical protein H6592_13235 [Flavobacteriales bacterium]|nr:hypothetical protein [Flavobacteriales bacterium]
MDLDPGPGSTMVSCPGSTAAWVAKYDAAGIFSWGFALGNVGQVSARGLVEDENGYLHVVGYFDGSVDLDPDAGQMIVTSAGDWDIWYLVLDANGSFIRGGRIGGTDQQYPTDIGKDGNGSIWLSGVLNGPADMDPGPGTSFLSGSEDNDAFIARYDLEGTLAWAYPIPGVPYLAPDSTTGDVYVTTGSQTDWMTTQDLDPGTGLLPPLTEGEPSADYMALLKLDMNGELVWASIQRGHADLNAWDNKGLAIEVDQQGNVYWAGSFINDFNAYPGNDLTLDAPGTSSDGFLVKYSSTGSLIWEKRFGAANAFDHCSEILIGENGMVWVAGSFQGSAEVNSGGPSVQITSSGGYDIFLVAFDPSGELVWYGSVGGEADDGTPNLTAGPNGMRLSGFFNSTADLDPTTGTSTLTAQATDPFLVTFYPVLTTGVGPGERPAQLHVYPIPCTDVLYVEGAPLNCLLQLVNSVGGQVAAGVSDAPLYLHGVVPGYYVLRSIQGNTIVSTPVLVDE